MLSSLPAAFRDYGLSADVRTLLTFRKAVDKKLVRTLGDVYNTLKGIIVKEPEQMGPFTRAYYAYFLDINVEHGDTLEDAILRSETFKQWKEKYVEEHDRDIPDEELVTKFLDEVHLTSYDIKEVIDGHKLFNEDDPDLEDKDDPDTLRQRRENVLDKMADYSDVSLEELLEKMRKVKDQQRTDHQGGSHWIGTGGTSPFGHGGAAKNGIRAGGSGGGKMARKVMGDPKYFPVDKDVTLNDSNVDAALASVKGVIEESAIEKLDVPVTIKAGLQRGGLFLPELSNEREEKIQIIVLIDNGGYSMSPYVRIVRELFRKMKTRFAHDLEVFYFHNTIYDRVFKDAKRTQKLEIERLLQYDKNYRVFFIGDASMAPYELNYESVMSLKAIAKRYRKCVWLNPEPLRYWPITETIQAIKEMIPMFPMTPRGIERAVQKMNEKHSTSR